MTFTGAGVVCLLVTVVAMLLGYGKRDAHTHQALVDKQRDAFTVEAQSQLARQVSSIQAYQPTEEDKGICNCGEMLGR